MNVYLAMARARSDAALALQERIAALGIHPLSTWANDAVDCACDGRGAGRALLELYDEQLAKSAVLIVYVAPGDVMDPEMFIRVGQAIELHMPTLWIGPMLLDVHRPGFFAVEHIDRAIALLESWEKRLRGGIPDEMARRALWVALQAQEAREATTGA